MLTTYLVAFSFGDGPDNHSSILTWHFKRLYICQELDMAAGVDDGCVLYST